MKLEYQVCTKEQGKQIEELGVTAKSHFVWVIDPVDPEKWIIMERWMIEKEEKVSAFSCAEFGVMLPEHVFIEIRSGFELPFGLQIHKKQNEYLALYSRNDLELMNDYWVYGKHEAHTKADLAIKGLEEGWIKPEDLKL